MFIGFGFCYGLRKLSATEKKNIFPAEHLIYGRLCFLQLAPKIITNDSQNFVPQIQIWGIFAVKSQSFTLFSKGRLFEVQNLAYSSVLKWHAV